MNITETFRKQFDAEPQVSVRAPGRVNLIGEHIDYSGGHVMPMALECAIEIAATPRTDGQYRLWSVQYEELYEGPITPERTDDHFWTNYVFGVVHEFTKLGHEVTGFDAVIDGDIPTASGLSSSAALEVATAWMIQSLLGTDLTRMEIALLGQRAENIFVGVNCGIMDQAISAGGLKGHAMMLDCNELLAQQIPLDLKGEAAILVAHSGVHRGLSASAYNQRRGKCDAALEVIRKETGKKLACLCEATVEDLEASKGAMDDNMICRARHAIAEEARVQDAGKAVSSGDFAAFGKILNESHYSLRDDYEVSCDELDELTEMIRTFPGVYGSRVTGAGFGGCTISLIPVAAADKIIAKLKAEFYEPKGAKPVVFVSEPQDGVMVL